MPLEALQEFFVKRSERSYALAILNSSFKFPRVDRQRWPNVNNVFLQDSQDLVVARLSGVVLYACDY